uniref:Zinc finger protein n=1 Tax=Loa loa TaxID=7209 RepID=A0A1I7VHD3_LOALO
EPQTEPLDLSLPRMIERRIGSSNLSVPEVSGGQVKVSETAQDDVRLLNLSVEEVSEEQAYIGIKPKKSWFKSYQKESSRLEEHMGQDDARSLNLRRKSKEQTRIERKRKMSRTDTTRTGEKRFKCNICEKKFARKYDLFLHNRIHTGEKPFKCDICEKKFIRKRDLVVHNITHTGEKPFKCDICNQRFRRSDYALAHKRTHTDEMPFKCDMCEKNFTRRGSLFAHRRTHTGLAVFSATRISLNHSI